MTLNLRRLHAALLAALVGMCVVSTTNAALIFDDPTDETTLDVLLAGESIQVGDKLFDEFSYSIAPPNAPTATPPETIVVRPLFGGVNGDIYGIRFHTLLSDFAVDGVFTDVLLGFDVTALDQDFLIAGAWLTSNPTLIGPGVAQIVETITSVDDPNFSASLTVYDPAGLASPVSVDNVIFSEPQRTISVVKDMALFAIDGPPSGQFNAATISFVDQLFPQIPDPNQNDIPEPAAAALAMLGLVALSGRRRAC